MPAPHCRTGRSARAAALVLAGGLAGALGAGPAPAAGGPLRVVRVDSIIHPVAGEHLLDALAEADRDGAAALVIELDTPGGLLTSTRTITEALLAAETPVIVWV